MLIVEPPAPAIPHSSDEPESCVLQHFNILSDTSFDSSLKKYVSFDFSLATNNTNVAKYQFQNYQFS